MRTSLAFVLVLFAANVAASDTLSFTRTEMVYGRKDGLALMMIMQAPKQGSNGRAIISLVSGNWRSDYDMAARFEDKDKIYLDKGYTVFEVLTSSQPRYSIPDEVQDVKRAIRYVRFNAREFGIDPEKIGITGLSSGGHLALMAATADDKPVNSRDAVDAVSGRVQAIAVFYPPTDFLNYGQQGFSPAAMQAILVATGLSAAFDFKRWNDTTRTYVSVTDMQSKIAIAKENSPIYSVSADDPPVLIIHGDADRLVPLQQSQSIIKKFEEVHVPNKLIIKAGGNHGWRNSEVEEQNFVEWFDKYLK
ncbi:hypothetical protein BH11BAC4_BH11BAC4_22100 [soil metagenome]